MIIKIITIMIIIMREKYASNSKKTWKQHKQNIYTVKCPACCFLYLPFSWCRLLARRDKQQIKEGKRKREEEAMAGGSKRWGKKRLRKCALARW